VLIVGFVIIYRRFKAMQQQVDATAGAIDQLKRGSSDNATPESGKQGDGS